MKLATVTGKSEREECFHALHDAAFRPRMRQQLMQGECQGQSGLREENRS